MSEFVAKLVTLRQAAVDASAPGDWCAWSEEGPLRGSSKITHSVCIQEGDVLDGEHECIATTIHLRREGAAVLARSIAEMHNAFPKLAAVVEAATRVVHAEPPCPCGEMAPGPCCEACAADRELRAALAALDDGGTKP